LANVPHVYNAQIQTFSTMLHNLAVASVTGGFVIPLLRAYDGSDERLGFLVTMPVGLTLALLFAGIGQYMLRDLYPPKEL
jgi:hypothetical protein